ncbi:MAG: GNAT family N-acetyltransferase [Anaerolineae bacterium]|nr:GNAT family N-acetyltransferase [Anaerolineae bacterium]
MQKPSPLDALFTPHSVAVIGASDKPRSVGRTILSNLLAAVAREPSAPFLNAVYPVHPTQPDVLGVKAFPKISDVPIAVDLAVIATPASTMREVIRECAAAHVKCAIVIAAGFREIGVEGMQLEQEILEIAKTAGMRLLGPNCLGVIRPQFGLNATFAATMPRAGEIAFVSQSGALGTAVLDWSIRENFGFSAFVSVGSMLDIGWDELIDFLGKDARTESIVLYMESLDKAHAFLSAARQVALDKPMVVLKAGRSPQGAQVAHLHTGAIMECDAVLDAAFRRAGVLRVDSVSDLFEMAQVLAKQPRPRGPRLAILTNAGGPAVLATDALVSNGGALAELSAESLAQLDEILPLHWSHTNPIDMLGDAGPAEYARALDIVSHDANADGILVILTPQAMTDPTASAEALKPFAQIRTKPLLASWMGGAEVEIGANILRAAAIPVFPYPDRAVRMFNNLVRYAENLRALYETPVSPLLENIDRARVRELIDAARRDGRTILTEEESRQILIAYNIPFIETRLAMSAAQSSKFSDEFGYPVVMKINTDKLIRKTEYGGVLLNLTSANNVRTTFRAVKNTVTKLLGADKFHGVQIQPMLDMEHAHPLHLGSVLDPQFGPVLLLDAEKRPLPADARGIPVLLDATAALEQDSRYRDDALALPPLTTTLARRMIERTRVFRVLREAKLDLSFLEQVLARFSALVSEQLWIKAVEIHPLMVLPPSSENGPANVLALDARILLHDPAMSEQSLPRPAIRPYPLQYETTITLRDGATALLRPIRPDDELLLVSFHEKLSEQSIYLRYFHALNLSQRISHERLARVASIDYAREITLVVEHRAPSDPAQTNASSPELFAVARFTRRSGTGDAEFAVLIRDDVQRQGLGTILLTKLIEIARTEGIARLLGEILPENIGMKRLAEKMGFTLAYDIEQAITRVELSL